MGPGRGRGAAGAALRSPLRGRFRAVLASRPPSGRAHTSPARREQPLAVSKRPSYLKRQKEQQRLARAAEKRDARRARKHSKESQGDQIESLESLMGEGVDGDGVGSESEDEARGPAAE